MEEPLATPGRTVGAGAGAAEVRHVPAGGISVYASPDAAGAAIAELTAGAEVHVIGRRPPWVHLETDTGLDGWVDGAALAGVAVGAASPVPPSAPESSPTGDSPIQPKVIEKQGSSILLGTGPVVGAIGGIAAIIGTALPWVQTVGLLSSVDAYGLSIHVLNGWSEATKAGFELGTLIAILAAIGVVVSLISGGGIVRRLLGFAIVVICVVYVFQTQDLLTSTDRGIGTGLNVWDIVSYGVVVSFGGGLVMLCAPSR